MTEKLKPCPHCGGEASESIGQYPEGTPWKYIECLKCSASSEPEVWNTRPIEDALRATIEKKDAETCSLLMRIRGLIELKHLSGEDCRRMLEELLKYS
jgi:hypothetical protein